MTKFTRRLVAAMILFCFSPADLRAQTPANTDSLLMLVKEAYIYGFPAGQVYRMYVTLPDNAKWTEL